MGGAKEAIRAAQLLIAMWKGHEARLPVWSHVSYLSTPGQKNSQVTELPGSTGY